MRYNEGQASALPTTYEGNTDPLGLPDKGSARASADDDWMAAVDEVVFWLPEPGPDEYDDRYMRAMWIVGGGDPDEFGPFRKKFPPRSARGPRAVPGWTPLARKEAEAAMTGPPRRPDLVLRGEELTDGNAMGLVNAVLALFRAAGVPQVEQDVFVREALSGDYQKVLRTVGGEVAVTWGVSGGKRVRRASSSPRMFDARSARALASSRPKPGKTTG